MAGIDDEVISSAELFEVAAGNMRDPGDTGIVVAAYGLEEAVVVEDRRGEGVAV